MKINFFPILSVLLSSCNYIAGYEGKTENVIDSAIVFDASEAFKQPKVSLSQVAYDFKVVFLETSDESIVSDVRNVDITDDRIYVYDSYKNGGVAIFDKEGRFLKRLPHGQGPEEIGTASDMCFDQISGNLFVSDQTNLKVLKYTKDGDFISCQPDPVRGVAVSVIDNAILHTQQRFQNYNDEFQIIKEDSALAENIVWRLEQEPFHVIIRPNFQFYENGMNIYIPYSGNIYYYQSNKIYKKYTVVGNCDVNLHEFENHWDALETVSDDEYVPMGKFAETKDCLYCWMRGKSKYLDVFINKNTGAMQCAQFQRQDFQYYIHVIGVSSASRNEMLAIVMPEWLFENDYSESHWEGNIPEGLFSPADMEKLRSVKPDDNPVIVLFKLKSEL